MGRGTREKVRGVVCAARTVFDTKKPTRLAGSTAFLLSSWVLVSAYYPATADIFSEAQLTASR